MVREAEVPGSFLNIALVISNTPCFEVITWLSWTWGLKRVELLVIRILRKDPLSELTT